MPYILSPSPPQLEPNTSFFFRQPFRCLSKLKSDIFRFFQLTLCITVTHSTLLCKHTHTQSISVYISNMNNLLNVRRPAQYATGRPAARVMPTISSDASSDNSEGGAPLHDKMTFSEMRMSQVERNRMQRDAVAAEASKVPDDHAAGPRLSDSSATASTFSAGEQKFKAGQGSRNHELNPASNMFIPSSATVNDLTKLQVSSCNHITSKPDLIASFVLSPTQTFT